MSNEIADSIIRTFMSGADLIYDRFVQEKTLLGPPSFGYHYTTFDAGLSILNDKYLWFSDSMCTNDSLEMIHFFKIAENVISLFSKKSIFPRYWELFLKNFIHFHVNDVNTFIASFCRREDSLSAWRLYGDRCRGIAIGFTFDFLDNLTIDSSELCQLICKINYKDNDAFNYCINLLNYAEKIMIYGYEKIKSQMELEYFLGILGRLIYAKLLICFPAYKNEEWSTEEEVRLIIYSKPPYISPLNEQNLFYRKSRKDKKSKFFNSNQYLIKTLKRPFVSSQVFHLIIGSGCNFKSAKTELEGQLKKAGYCLNAVKIVQSNLGFRN